MTDRNENENEAPAEDTEFERGPNGMVVAVTAADRGRRVEGDYLIVDAPENEGVTREDLPEDNANHAENEDLEAEREANIEAAAPEDEPLNDPEHPEKERAAARG